MVKQKGITFFYRERRRRRMPEAKTFSSLEQRMAHYYLDTFPPFVPDEGAEIDIEEQKRFYDFMSGLYQLIYDEPGQLAPILHDDDAYPTGVLKNRYATPKLGIDMRRFLKAMEALLANTLALGRGEPGVVLNKRERAILSRLGFEDFSNLPPAWVWMAARQGASLSSFSRCFFKRGYPYASDIFAGMFGDESVYRRLETWMLDRGYKLHTIESITANNSSVSLVYANPAWGADSPRGGFEYKIKHTGIAAVYEPERLLPAVFGLCIPNGLKAFLNDFESMGDDLKAFVAERTHKCSNCRYCVQTDKTGKRPMARIPVNFHGMPYDLCPLYPGWSYSWRSLDDALADRLIEFLGFMDATLT
jgi:hypothetical protein